MNSARNASARGHFGLNRLLETLRQPTPTERISIRNGPYGQAIPYLRWQDLMAILDQACTKHRGNWNSKIPWRDIENGRALVQCRLTITGGDGNQASREAIAQVNLHTASADYAPPMEVAERKALKRAAALFGVGADLNAPATRPEPLAEEYPQDEQPDPGPPTSPPRHENWRYEVTSTVTAQGYREGPKQTPETHDVCPDCGGSKGMRLIRCPLCQQTVIWGQPTTTPGFG